MSTTRQRATRLISTLVIALAGAAGACSAGDPGVSGQRTGPVTTGGLVDGSTNMDPTQSPDAAVDPPGTPSPDASTTTPDASNMSASDASDAPSGPAVLSFTLIDASITNLINGSPVTGFDPIPDNSTISLATVGATLSVRANLNVTTIGSVGFVYNGTNHTENATPYVLCGDNGAGTITDCALTAGTYTITATPYSAADLGGTAGIPHTVHFTLTP